MARLPRFFVPGVPLHVIQRGNNRQSIFGGPPDRILFLRLLLAAALEHGVAIHAYALMPNHVHLLATPASPDAIPGAVQSVGRAYVQRFNLKNGRTGTLWEGRYRAAIVDDERYLLTCMRYIELNPVRAGLAGEPSAYRWSSYRANAAGRFDALVSPHPLYLSLGETATVRQAAYREIFAGAIPDDDLRLIRDSTQHAWAIGDASFGKVVASNGRRPARSRRGRPPKSNAGKSSLTPIT
ncbi:MAG: transposase [Burkholderiales bacterium]|nr:transposase [Burkholderiales bacterium]